MAYKVWTDRKKKERFCKFCEKAFYTREWRQTYCSHKCAGLSKRGQKRNNYCLTESQRIKVGLKIKERFIKTRGLPKNIYEIANRTRWSVLNLMKLGCSRCGWKEASCDLHHIRGRKIPDCHNHSNLSLLCPNCHRMAEEGKISQDELITFEDQAGSKWIEAYCSGDSTCLKSTPEHHTS